jgi:dUTP pyrophosphatase
MNIKIINHSDNPLPKYATTGASGMDLTANLSENISIKAGEWALVPTGIHIQIPEGYEAQVRARSGLALKYGIGLLNGIGTIDSDYVGEIKVILINHSKENFEIKHNDRIAQLVIAKYEHIAWESVTELTPTQRGEDGFGSTGK